MKYLAELKYTVFRSIALKYLKRYAGQYLIKSMSTKNNEESTNIWNKGIVYRAAIKQMEAEQALRKYKQDTI